HAPHAQATPREGFSKRSAAACTILVEKPWGAVVFLSRKGSLSMAALPQRRAIPDDHLHDVARNTMRAHFIVMREKGKTAAEEPEQFYGFRAEDVTDIHFNKQGFGRGIWYRLQDGRVIDVLGK